MASLSDKIAHELTQAKKEQKVYALISPAQEYQEVNREILRVLTKNSKQAGIYVTLNKSCTEIEADLKKAKIELKNILFIDATEESTHSGSCIPLQGNYSLTKLSLAISQACKHTEIKFILFDSVSTLLMYNDANSTQKFIRYITSKVKNLGIWMAIISIDEKKSNELAPVLGQFCDKMVRL